MSSKNTKKHKPEGSQDDNKPKKQKVTKKKEDEEEEDNVVMENTEGDYPLVRFPKHFSMADFFLDKRIEEGKGDNVAIYYKDQEITYKGILITKKYDCLSFNVCRFFIYAAGWLFLLQVSVFPVYCFCLH